MADSLHDDLRALVDKIDAAPERPDAIAAAQYEGMVTVRDSLSALLDRHAQAADTNPSTSITGGAADRSGFRLVPVEPNAGQLAVGVREFLDGNPLQVHASMIAAIYRVMVNAADGEAGEGR